MASWIEIAGEMASQGQSLGLPMDFDGVRRQKMRAIEQLTSRPLVVYAVDTANSAKTAQNPIAGLINFSDKDGFLEALEGLRGDRLDILLHSPGGLAESTESIVALLRKPIFRYSIHYSEHGKECCDHAGPLRE